MLHVGMWYLYRVRLRYTENFKNETSPQWDSVSNWFHFLRETLTDDNLILRIPVDCMRMLLTESSTSSGGGSICQLVGRRCRYRDLRGVYNLQFKKHKQASLWPWTFLERNMSWLNCWANCWSTETTGTRHELPFDVPSGRDPDQAVP